MPLRTIWGAVSDVEICADPDRICSASWAGGLALLGVGDRTWTREGHEPLNPMGPSRAGEDLERNRPARYGLDGDRRPGSDAHARCHLIPASSVSVSVLGW